MKVDNIKPEKIVSSSPLVTVHKTMSKDLDEKVAKLHFPTLGLELTDLTQEQAGNVGVKVDDPASAR